MRRPHYSPLFSAADELPSGGGTAASAPVIPIAEAVEKITEAADNKLLSIGQRFDIIKQVAKGIDPTGQLATAKAELDKVKEELTAEKSRADKLQADLLDLDKQILAREKDLQEADAARLAAEKRTAELEAAEQDLEKRAAAKSKEKLGALGVKSTELPKQDPKHTDLDDKASAEDQIRKLPGTKRAQAAIYFKAQGKLPDWMAS